MSPTTAGLLGICILIGLMFLRMPVGFTMAIVGFAGFAYLVSFDASTGMAVNDIFSSFGSYNLTVIPLFVFMGQLAFHAGISGRLFHAAYRIMGHWRGGLAMATIGACAGFAAIFSLPTRWKLQSMPSSRISRSTVSTAMLKL